MDVVLLTDPTEFAVRSAAMLAVETLSANVISVVLERTLRGDLTPTPNDRWIVAIHADTVVGVAMLNAPYNLFASRQPEAAAAAIAEALHADGFRPPGITAEASVAEAVARRWCELTGQQAELQIAHTAYALRSPESLVAPCEQHSTRAADGADSGRVAQWLEEFHSEALPHDPAHDNAALAAARIGRGEVWLAEATGTPAAMAAITHPAAGVARVGPVYTPPEQRSRGYAAAATAAACEAGFAAGANAIMLYADRSNPTSNALYQRLGFDQDHEAADYGFRDQPRG